MNYLELVLHVVPTSIHIAVLTSKIFLTSCDVSVSLLHHSGMPCCRSNTYEAHMCLRSHRLPFSSSALPGWLTLRRCPCQLTWNGAEWGRTSCLPFPPTLMYQRVWQQDSSPQLHLWPDSLPWFTSIRWKLIPAGTIKIVSSLWLPSYQHVVGHF